MNIGIAISAVVMVLMAVALVYSLKTLMDAPTVSLIVPGVEKNVRSVKKLLTFWL